MGLDYLTMNITYNMDNGEFNIDGDVKKDKQYDLIADFLRLQMGQGKDTSKPNEQDVYHISISWHPYKDRFESRSDTGNKGLRDGILMDVLKQIK